MRRFALPLLITILSLLPSTARAISFDDALKNADPTAKYLVYLHGAILETGGKNAVSPRYGAYKYDAIIKHFEDRGLVVVEEVRGRVNPNRYASWLVGWLHRLKAKGVPSSNITLAGFSKGGFIALLVASSLNDPDMRYAILAGCGRSRIAGSFQHFLKTKRGGRLQGNILSVYAGSDLDAGSCQAAVQQASGKGLTFRETRIRSTRGHGLFYVALPQWINPVALFAKGGQ